MAKKKAPRPALGRPREFDHDVALDAAMRVFWKNGYEGASLSDLTKAMRINRPSMYAAFGDKEQLFRLAFDHYAETALSYMRDALLAPTLREVVELGLRGTAEFLSRPDNPCGCLSVHGALATSDAGTRVKRRMAEFRKRGLDDLTKRIRQAKKKGELSPEIDPAGFARYLAALVQGLAVQGASGATRQEMDAMVTVALRLTAL